MAKRAIKTAEIVLIAVNILVFGFAYFYSFHSAEISKNALAEYKNSVEYREAVKPEFMKNRTVEHHVKNTNPTPVEIELEKRHSDIHKPLKKSRGMKIKAAAKQEDHIEVPNPETKIILPKSKIKVKKHEPDK